MVMIEYVFYDEIFAYVVPEDDDEDDDGTLDFIVIDNLDAKGDK